MIGGFAAPTRSAIRTTAEPRSGSSPPYHFEATRRGGAGVEEIRNRLATPSTISHAPDPTTAHWILLLTGLIVAATTGRPSTQSASITSNRPVRATYCWVPSIGSAIQQRDFPSRSRFLAPSSVSSPSSGNAAAIASLMILSDARSASVTGEPSPLIYVSAD